MYDVVILGAGIGGLTTAAVLASQGKKVCLVEQHPHLGGFAHTFKIGDFKFVAGTQYLNGCNPDGTFRRLCELVGIGGQVQFNGFDPDGFDVICPPHFSYAVPSGFDNFRDRLMRDFPESAANLRKYFAAIERIYDEVRPYERTPYVRHLRREPLGFLTLLRYIGKTIQQVFDAFDFPPDLQIILNGQAGNMGDGPLQASWVILGGMQKAYCDSAAYPRFGMEHFIGLLTNVITSSPGSVIMTDAKVLEIKAAGRAVESVLTSRGVVKGRHFISNIDPMRTLNLLGASTRQSYEYSDCVFFVHYCFKDVPIERYGFGRRNFWLHTTSRIQDEFDGLLRGNRYSKPWIFVSSPSMLTDPGVLCRAGSHVVTALTFLPFDKIKRLATKDLPAHDAIMAELGDVFDAELSRRFRLPIDQVSQRVVMTPLDMLERVDVPNGNVYGPRITPGSYGVFRFNNRSRWHNLRFCGHASSFPGLMPIVANAMATCAEVLGRPLVPARTGFVQLQDQSVSGDLRKDGSLRSA